MRAHRVEASFGVRAGTHNLESDLDYERYLGQGSYRYDFGRHHVQATGMAGRITGTAPLFERFTLGDSTTLRGWDKYDIAPAGGDRMFYSSIEYRYTGLALFLDIGSVWDAGTERKVRVSTGFGLHAGPAFLVVGFPLNTDNLTAVVIAGSANLGGWDPVVAPARRAAVVLLALLAWPAVRSSAQTLTVDIVGEVLKIRAPGFSFLTGRSARSIERWPIGARRARRDGAARAGKVAGGDHATELRVELRSLGGAIRRDDGGHAVPVRLAPDDGRRRGVVRRTAGHPRQRAWRAGPRSAALDSARVPRAGWRQHVGCGRLGLHVAGAHRRVESTPQDRVIAAYSRGRSIPAAVARLVLAAMNRLRNRLIAAFLASTLLPLVRHRLDHDVAPRSQPAVCDNRRARSTLADARDHREAVLSAGTRRAEAGRARRPDTADAVRGGDRGRVARARPLVLGER